MPVISTVCPRNCYSTCGLNVTVAGGRITGIEPDSRNRATGEGVCLKGLSYVERIVSPDRIVSPLRRLPGTDRFEPIGWDEALELIAEKLRFFREKSGPSSVLYYTGSGTKGVLNAVGLDFWRLFGGCTTTYGDLCWPAGLEATRLTLGENKHNAPWDLSRARLILLWGKNPAETNVHQMRFIDQAIEQGARLVVIDPRRTQSSERAELLIQPRPGTDGALALAAARLLVNDSKIDRVFVDEHLLGFDAFSEKIDPFTPDEAAAICGVPAGSIRRLAGLLGSIRPATLCAGFGMQRYTNSGQTMRAMIALMAITGNIGRPGGGWQFANLQSHIFGSPRDPLAFYPPESRDGTVRVSISTARLGRDILAASDPALRMIWVERGNPVTQNPDTNKVLEAFRSLDFRVVVDQFLTDTAREADIVLPAKTFFEQTDLINAYWHPYIQLKRKILDPPAGVKPETEIYRLLALRLGITDEMMRGKIPGSSEREIESFLEEKLEKIPGVTLERLKQGPLPAPGAQEVAFSDLRFPTPSGKIEIFSEQAADRWGADPLPLFAEPEETARSGGAGRQTYPLHLITPNTKDTIHSQFGNLRLIRAQSPGPHLLINPDDAARRGIRMGDAVRVFNGRGSFRAPARLDFSLRTGCVSCPNGLWIREGGAVNFCSLGRETDMGHGAAFHDNQVEVERIGP